METNKLRVPGGYGPYDMAAYYRDIAAWERATPKERDAAVLNQDIACKNLRREIQKEKEAAREREQEQREQERQEQEARNSGLFNFFKKLLERQL